MDMSFVCFGIPKWSVEREAILFRFGSQDWRNCTAHGLHCTAWTTLDSSNSSSSSSSSSVGIALGQLTASFLANHCAATIDGA